MKGYGRADSKADPGGKAAGVVQCTVQWTEANGIP
jgi:hypothetical protein